MKKIDFPISLLVPCLMVFASARVLAQDPSPSAGTEIKTATSTLVVDQVILSTTWLPGCKPPNCVTAKAPVRFLAVIFKPLEQKDAMAAGNINAETEKAYVVTPEGAKAKRWDFGFIVDSEGRLTYILGFKVRSTGDVFSLSWPGGADYKLTAAAQK